MRALHRLAIVTLLMSAGADAAHAGTFPNDRPATKAEIREALSIIHSKETGTRRSVLEKGSARVARMGWVCGRVHAFMPGENVPGTHYFVVEIKSQKAFFPGTYMHDMKFEEAIELYNDNCEGGITVD